MTVSVVGTTKSFTGEVLSALEVSGGYFFLMDLPTISRTNPEVSSAEVATTLQVPLGAVVTKAVVRLSADAPGTTTIGGIATVRAAAGEPDGASDQLVVDFGTLRTVSAIAAPAAISHVTPWAGTSFLGGVTLLTSLSGMEVSFTEVQTERLLIDLGANTLPSALAGSGLVTTTTPPADLELRVGGSRVWSRTGPAPAGFTEDVDVTAAVQAIVDTATVPDADGNVGVRVALSARVPGKLGLDLPEEPRFLRTLAVNFPGTTAPVVFAEEGVADLTLPLPAGSEQWTIHRVVATVSATDPGPVRVLPPNGPAVSAEAEVLVDSDHRVLARLPRTSLGRFERLAGVRLLLVPGPSGFDVGGTLHSGTATVPGEAIEEGSLSAVNLPPGAPDGQPAWVTLLLPRPIELAAALKPAPEDALWLSIEATRGSARMMVADRTGMDDGDVALLRRLAPNGIARPLSTAFRLRTQPADPPSPIAADALALRVVGLPPVDHPVALVSTDLAGGGSSGVSGPGGSVTITLNPIGVRSPLALRLTATAATAVTAGPVVVAYTESSPS